MCDIDPLKQAIKDTCDDFTLGKHKKVQAMALAIGSHPDYLRNKVNLSNPDKVINLFEARQMMLVSGNYRILHALSHECAGVFYQLPDMEFPADTDLMEKWSDWEVDHAQTIQALKEAITHGITRTSIAEIRRELLEDLAAGLAMISVLDGMSEPEDNVTPMKAKQGH